MTDIEFNCPTCQHLLVVDERGAGKKVKCPKCSGELVIPTPEDSEAEQPSGTACPKCGAISPTPNAKFCMKCATNLQLSLESVKCPNCSADLPLTQERYEALTGSDIRCFKCNNTFAIPFDTSKSQRLTLRDKSKLGEATQRPETANNLPEDVSLGPLARRSLTPRRTAYAGEETLSIGLGVLGSIVLFIGTLTPLIKFPALLHVMGTPCLYKLGNQGIIVMILAGCSLFISLMREPRFLWLTLAGSIAVVYWAYSDWMEMLTSFLELMGIPKDEIGNALKEGGGVPWDWGAWVLLAGLGILLLAALTSNKGSSAAGCLTVVVGSVLFMLFYMNKSLSSTTRSHTQSEPPQQASGYSPALSALTKSMNMQPPRAQTPAPTTTKSSPPPQSKLSEEIQKPSALSAHTEAAAAKLVETGFALVNRGQGADAFQHFKQAATLGYALGQFNLGLCYHNGDGVREDKAEAVRWFRKAAEQGNVLAQNNLGACYFGGDGVIQDRVEAASWFRKAAELGSADAQTRLGNCYSRGDGVTQNPTEAVKWYRQAAEQGDVFAQVMLGQCYYKGEGVTENKAEAVKWYRKAAEQGDVMAQKNLGIIYSNGDGVPRDKMEAFIWYGKAARQGDKDSITCYNQLNYELSKPYRDLQATKERMRRTAPELNPDDPDGNMKILKRRVEAAGLKWPGDSQ